MSSPTRTLKRLAVGLAARLVRRAPLSPGELVALRPGRILVVRQHNQMGDMLCATPVFRALRETYPDARIGLVTAPVNGDVVRNNPHLDRIFTFDQKMWRNPVRLSGFLREIRDFQPDLAFVLASVSFSMTSAAIALASAAPLVVGADSEPFGFDFSRRVFSLVMPASPRLDRHAIPHSLAPLQAVGITTRDLSPVMVPSDREKAAAEAILAGLSLAPGYWALHPGAGKRQNIWPTGNFARLARRAVEQGHRVLVLHGPADREVLADLEDMLGDESGRRILSAPSCSIGVGAALLARADRFLCNDTGVMHLAGAVGVPTVALFGPTDPGLWKPPGELVQAIRSPRQVPDSRGGEFGWMENITPEEVWAAWSALPGRGGRE